MQGRDAAASAVSSSVSGVLSASFRMLRARPVTSGALGAAIAFSLLSTCCGLGLLTTPFFICELLSLQLSMSTGRAIERGAGYVRACVHVLGVLLMVGAVLVISLLGSASEQSASPLTPTGVAAALAGSAAAWLVTTPLLYAPLMMLERGMSPELALAESARLTLRVGISTSARLALRVFALQHAPFVLAATLISVDDSRAALWVLLTAPLLCVSLPLGQGMLVSAYAQLSGHDPLRSAVMSMLPPQASGLPTSTSLAPPLRRWVRVWVLLIVLPIASLLLLELVLSRPSRIAEVAPFSLPPQGELLRTFAPAQHPDQVEQLELPASALTLHISPMRVSVVASDGGGVGELPLSAAGAIERVRVVRVRDTFAIELQQAGHSYLTRIDRAGVRLDDDFPARLRDRSRPWQWLYLLWTLLFTLLSSVPVLSELAEAGRVVSAGSPLSAAVDESSQDAARARAQRRAGLLALLLLPWGLGCLMMALYALFTA
jgi:hypothetical protein